MSVNPPHRLIRFAMVSVLATVLGSALVGCSGSADNEASASPSTEAAAEPAEETTEETTPTEEPTEESDGTWEAADDDLGVSFTAELPAGWESGTASGTSVIRSQDPVDGFSANAYAQFQALPTGTTIDDLAADVTATSEALTKWTSSQPDGQQITIDGQDAFMLSGLFTDATAGQIARSTTAILYDGADGPVAVYIVASTGPSDTVGQDEISTMLATVAFD